MANVSVHILAPRLDSALHAQRHRTETQKLHAENANNSDGACAGSAPLRRQQALLGCSFDSVVLRPPCNGSSASPPGPLIPPDPCSLRGFRHEAPRGWGNGRGAPRTARCTLEFALRTRSRCARSGAGARGGRDVCATGARNTCHPTRSYASERGESARSAFASELFVATPCWPLGALMARHPILRCSRRGRRHLSPGTHFAPPP